MQQTEPEPDQKVTTVQSSLYATCSLLIGKVGIYHDLFILHSVRRQEARRRAWPLLGPEIRRLNRSQARATLGAVTNGQKGAAANWSRGFLTGDATQ